MDSKTIVTKRCLNLTVKGIVHIGGFVRDRCLQYITVTIKPEAQAPNASPPPEAHSSSSLTTSLIIGPVVVVLAVMAGITGFALLYCTYRRQQSQATFRQFLCGLTPCSYLRGRFFQPGREGREIGNGAVLQAGRDNENDGQVSSPNGGSIRLSELSSTQLTLQNGINAGSNGRNPEALSPDHSLSNGGTRLSDDNTSGDRIDVNPDAESVPDINPAWNHRDMDRNLRGDPGGVNDNKENDINIRVMPDDPETGDQSLEGHESEGQPLLSNKPTAIPDFNMTGEPAGLVNELGRDPDQVRMCSTVLPDTGSSDVESPSKMFNRNNSTYIQIENKDNNE
ncbi:uncharacterized protein LOC115363328 [Myripristis murdjan]|uniref:uncharacterized protein LOC115363328 n=1 Tax=Myripristis murdjan TaxID=586833 RepID=UPI001175FD03|nr:uncharacterized protein LOC115363328 [Myripristis murdjan]